MLSTIRIALLSCVALAASLRVASCNAGATTQVSNADDRAAPVVTTAAYVDFAQAALLESLRSREGRVELTTRGDYRDVALASGGDLKLRARVANADATPNVVVWVDIVVANRIVRHLPVHFRVSRFLPALVAKRRLPARSGLETDMFEQREMNVARVRGGAVTSLAQLRGKRLRRELAADDVLPLAAIEERPPVEVGERIQIVAHIGRVTVQTTAIAQRDGFTGQRIDARLLDGSTTLSVEVVGEDRARVQGDG